MARNALAWCEGACIILLHLLISPCVKGSARAGCLLLGRKDPCCIHYRGVTAISCSGRSVGFFPCRIPLGRYGEGAVLAGLAPELG